MAFISNPLYVLTILCLSVGVTEWLVQTTFCRHLGTALLVIVLTALLANIGLLPTASNASPVYDIVFTYLAPISIFYLLLGVNLRDLKQAGLPMLLTFLIGSVGTLVGVFSGMWVVSGQQSIGEFYRAIAGMFAGTYTGGGINFNAIALHYQVMKQGALFAGAVAVDNIMTTLWMVVTIALPKLVSRVFAAGGRVPVNQPAIPHEEADRDVETLSPMDLAVMIGLGVVVLWVSNAISAWLARYAISVPSILILTTIALALAQFPFFNQLRGSRLIGMFAVYIFLAVIGAYCEFAALSEIGDLGETLLAFGGILVLVHGAIAYGIGAIVSRDWELLSIASQANVGGSTSALALAKSFERPDLLLPAILVGSLGNALGTYLGFMVARFI